MFAFNKEDEESNMTLTKEEVRWTQAVKAAALADETIPKLTDYEYAQQTIFNKGDVKRTLFQLEGLQQFKEEYKITDTVEEGMAVLRQYHEQMPGFFLDIGFEDNNFVLVYDYAALKPALIKDWRAFLGGTYYIFSMAISNLHATREGVVFVGEVQGVGWENVSIDFTHTFWEHFFRFFPLNFKEIAWMGNSVVSNIFESLHKSIMNERSWDINIGVQNEQYDGRLDTIFKVPTPEIALDRLMNTCQMLLTKRFERFQTFKLSGVAPELTIEDSLLREASEEGIDDEMMED